MRSRLFQYEYSLQRLIISDKNARTTHIDNDRKTIDTIASCNRALLHTNGEHIKPPTPTNDRAVETSVDQSTTDDQCSSLCDITWSPVKKPIGMMTIELSNLSISRLLRTDQLMSIDRQSRSIVSIAAAIARSALKLRYWIAGGTIGGGVAVANVRQTIQNLYNDLGYSGMRI